MTPIPSDPIAAVVRLGDPLGSGPGTAVPARGVPMADVLDWVRRTAPDLPRPGYGRTGELWSWLATLGAWDLGQARAAEPHLDALAVLDESGGSGPDGTWGVWAAEGGGTRLTATSIDGKWSLSGTKPWCSLAGQVTHALVTAWTQEGDVRALFAVDTRQDGIETDASGWRSRGLAEVVTSTVSFDDVAVAAVGEPGWYLHRPGFAWGGMGVAAVWFGGAVGLARRLLSATTSREPDQVALAHLGAVDARLFAAGALLEHGARLVDAGAASGPAGARLAAEVRQVVADTVDEVIWRCGHALGPGVLTAETEHLKRVADLTVYVRQHHAERDAAALGALVLDRATGER